MLAAKPDLIPGTHTVEEEDSHGHPLTPSKKKTHIDMILKKDESEREIYKTMGFVRTIDFTSTYVVVQS